MQTTVLPSYLYEQYTNDYGTLSSGQWGVAGYAVSGEAITGCPIITEPISYVGSFFEAYNNTSQKYLDQTNNLNLPIYTLQYGGALDWVALGIYGMTRPVLPYGGEITKGVYNEAIFNEAVYNGNIILIPSGFYETTDDIFKRIITWNFYKGDGFQFNTTWLKNRIYRFLVQANGVPKPISNTYGISVTFSPINVVDITIDPSIATYAPILSSAIESGAINLPFQYTFNVSY